MWITPSLLKLDCLVLSASSFWLHVISHMSQSPLQRTPSSICQQKIVWDAFAKSSSVGISSVPACLQVINQVLSLTTVCLRPARNAAWWRTSNALYFSSQRAVPLRCDFVNDDFSTSESTTQPFDGGNARAPLPGSTTCAHTQPVHRRHLRSFSLLH